MENKKIDRVIEAFRNYISLKEEGMVTGPTNNVGGGKIAGTPQADPGNPPVFFKKKKNGTVDFRRIKPNYRKWVKDK